MILVALKVEFSQFRLGKYRKGWND